MAEAISAAVAVEEFVMVTSRNSGRAPLPRAAARNQVQDKDRDFIRYGTSPGRLR